MAAGVRRLVQYGVHAARGRLSLEAAVPEERHEPVRPDGDRAVFRDTRRPADQGQLRERPPQRLLHLRTRPASVSHLQALQTFAGLSSLRRYVVYAICRMLPFPVIISDQPPLTHRTPRPRGCVVQRYSIGLWPVSFRCPALDLQLMGDHLCG